MYIPILSGLILILAIIIVMVFAYYTTIIIGKKTNRLFNSGYVKVLQRISIGLNTSIAILQVNKKIYIVALQGKAIELLDVINEEDWEFVSTNTEQSFNFEVNDFIKNKLFRNKKSI